MEFSIRTGNKFVMVEGTTHESTLLKYLMGRRRVLLRVRDPTEANRLFSELPRRAKVSGGGSTRSYRVRWEKVGTSKFGGSRYVFTVEESRLGGLLRRKVGA